MRKNIQIIFLSCLSFLVVSCKNKMTCDDLRKRYFSIVTNIHTNYDTTQFIKELDYLIEKKPHCLKALQVRGYILMARAEYSRAKKDFIAANKIDSLNPYTLFYTSMLYNFESKNDSALFLINRAIRIKNNNGVILEENSLFSDNLDIKYDQMINFRGIIFYERGQFIQAKHDFFYCINDNYIYNETYGYLAAIYSDENKMDSACFFHKKSIVNGYDDVLDSSLIWKCK